MTLADPPAMRGILLLSLFALTSCVGLRDTFTVDDPDGLARSAVLQLEGYDQQLDQSGRRFTTTRRIHRDADGRIRVTYIDGRHVDCIIGYVTPNAGQHWDFRLTPTACEPVNAAASAPSRHVSSHR